MFSEPEVIARTFWNLQTEANAIMLQIGDDGEVTAQRLKDELILAVAHAQPRSRLISWHLPDRDVEVIINRVVEEVLK